MLNTSLQQLVLLENLEGDDILRLYLTSEVNSTKLTATERLSYLEVLEGPLQR